MRQSSKASPSQAIQQKTEELQLLEQVVAGDERAWSRFCQRYEGLIVGCVLRVLRRYNASFNSDDLADMVAEVWVMLLRNDKRKLRLYDPQRGYRLTSWLGLLASNCTIDQLRMRCSETAYLEDMTCPDTLLVTHERPDCDMEQQESAALARMALGQLSADEREFVLWCFHEERAPAEMAQELGIAVNTVYSRKFKIREKLVRIVADMRQQEPLLALAA